MHMHTHVHMYMLHVHVHVCMCMYMLHVHVHVCMYALCGDHVLFDGAHRRDADDDIILCGLSVERLHFDVLEEIVRAPAHVLGQSAIHLGLGALLPLQCVRVGRALDHPLGAVGLRVDDGDGGVGRRLQQIHLLEHSCHLELVRFGDLELFLQLDVGDRLLVRRLEL